ncbi:MAG: hypothetical protein RIR70_1147 [Pseudomonadota bacterium]|jgi:flagellar basal-body rod protein FlgC
MSLLKSIHIGATALVAQAKRLNVVSSNLANAESVSGPDGKAYRAKHVYFQTAPLAGEAAAGVEVASVVEDQSPLRKVHRPGHPNADASGFVELPNVNPVEEMVDMISAARSYQMNIEAMTTSRQLLLKTLDLGRS